MADEGAGAGGDADPVEAPSPEASPAALEAAQPAVNVFAVEAPSAVAGDVAVAGRKDKKKEKKEKKKDKKRKIGEVGGEAGED
mmetsp:Transcript_33/g.103  ORF Transcript_33/g.103 Transcript_33/m.103 type:complete len:83 (-) Transcript_33:143-391(-)